MIEIILIIFIVFGMLSVPLKEYIQYIEDEKVCSECKEKKKCFAQKELLQGRSNVVSEWMVVAFLAVHKQCIEWNRPRRKEYVLYICLAIVIIFPFIWSKNGSNSLYLLTAEMLLALSVVDWYTQYIPVEYTAMIFLCGLIHLFADYSNWLQYLIGLIAVSGFLYIVNLIATPILRKKYEEEVIYSVIGDGDIKLMAATGLLLGWKLNFIALAIGCIIGSMIHLILMKIKGSGRQFAFGPYLSLGVYITMIYGEQLVSWYLSMLGM